MDFDFTALLLTLPVVFALGWFASRLDLRQLRIDNRQAPKAYFKGLNYLLNEQQDQAIDAFIEAVQNDPDTSELHFALGNLFRRRGEYERAVRVHEHLLARGDLNKTERERAQHALALDFLKAGLIDRAEDALAKLEGTRFQTEAHLALLSIYERSREWASAAAIASKLEANGQGSFAARRAHYLCEQAAASKDASSTRALLQQAIDTAPQSARAALSLAAQHQQAGDAAQALQILQALAERVPTAMPLIAQQLPTLAKACAQEAAALQLLQNHYAHSPSLDVLHAMTALQPGAGARDWYVKHLEHTPSLVAATHWIAGERLEHEQFHPLVQRALDHATKPLQRYRCAACGFEAQQHFWQCPGCQTWDSFPPVRVEEL
jgi:lipopolysaccharide assembly protein B